MPRVVHPAKIALLDFGLQRMHLRMGIAVEITDPKQLEAVREQSAFRLLALAGEKRWGLPGAEPAALFHLTVV